MRGDGADAAGRERHAADEHRAGEDADVAGDAAVDDGDAGVAQPERRVALRLVDEHLGRGFVEGEREQVADFGQLGLAGGADLVAITAMVHGVGRLRRTHRRGACATRFASRYGAANRAEAPLTPAGRCT